MFVTVQNVDDVFNYQVIDAVTQQPISDVIWADDELMGGICEVYVRDSSGKPIAKRGILQKTLLRRPIQIRRM